jgi:integrase
VVHDLRHAYAIAEIRADRDIYDLSHHLGHSSVKVTEIYLGYRAGGRSVSRATVTQKLTQEGVLDSTETVDEMELET